MLRGHETIDSLCISVGDLIGPLLMLKIVAVLRECYEFTLINYESIPFLYIQLFYILCYMLPFLHQLLSKEKSLFPSSF